MIEPVGTSDVAETISKVTIWMEKNLALVEGRWLVNQVMRYRLARGFYFFFLGVIFHFSILSHCLMVLYK
jgi:hypothetical protein